MTENNEREEGEGTKRKGLGMRGADRDGKGRKGKKGRENKKGRKGGAKGSGRQDRKEK